jgi:hypothetical protein
VGKKLLGGLVVVLALVVSLPAGAFAASGTPLAIGSGAPAKGVSVAVEADGTAIVSWADQSVPTANVVRWCVVAPGAGGCGAGGVLAPTSGSANPATQISVYNTQVLVDGPTVVILANVLAGNVENESVQEWQSTNGGLTFAAINGGKSVASGNTSPDTRMTNAVVLPGSLSVGVGFVSPAGEPNFAATELAHPTLCGRAAGKCPGGFATLGSEANADKVAAEPGSFATDGKEVMGVFRTNYGTGNFGCAGATPFGMAYTLGGGQQSPSNNYGVSPRQGSTAWITPVTKVDCDVDYLAVGGGPSGFGVLEDNQVTGQTQYHRFNQIANAFEPAANIVSGSREQQPSVSQDGAGGVYATYLKDGIGGPVSLSYSADGGISWAGPATLAADPLAAVANLTSSVNGGGQGWAAWSENGSVFVQPFVAADAGSANPPAVGPAPPAPPSPIAPTTITTSQKAGPQTGASITVPAGTTGETDQATIVGANAAHATGTVAYRLFPTPTCTGQELSSSLVTVNGALAPESRPVTVTLAPGTYYWQASYFGDSTNRASAGACGSEVLTVGSPNEIAAAATSNGQQVTVGVSCVEIPCEIHATLTTPEAAATASSTKTNKPKPQVLGKAKFKLKKKGLQKLTLNLSTKGRAYLKGKHKTKLSLAVTEKVKGHNVTTKRAITVKVTPAKRKKK